MKRGGSSCASRLADEEAQLEYYILTIRNYRIVYVGYPDFLATESVTVRLSLESISLCGVQFLTSSRTRATNRFECMFSHKFWCALYLWFVDGPQAMLKSAMLYGGFVYVLSGSMLGGGKQQLQFTEGVVDF
jgi:hypothetical protein